MKRILSIDGGGVRGVMAIEVLARLEDILAERAGSPDVRLADYFDLVAGTSAGAIIASAVPLGIPMREARKFMLGNAGTMFRPAGLVSRFHHHWYDKGQLEAELIRWLGADTTLGSDRLRTIVMLVMRNASTDSPWIVSSYAQAPYNQ